MSKTPTMQAATLNRLGLGLLVMAGCWFVVRPFLPAILYSAAIAMSTWPLHSSLTRRLHDRRSVASAISCLFVALLVIVPTTALVVSLRDASMWLLQSIEGWRSSSAQASAPAMDRVPATLGLLRNWLVEMVSARGDHPGAPNLVSLADPARRLAVAAARSLGNGVLQTLLAGLLLFFFYRDGERLAFDARQLVRRLGGARAMDLLDAAHKAMVGVMIGVIGAALAQSAVAVIGFMIVGAPQPLLLGSITFVLSVIPIGPPLVWGGVAVWLLQHGNPGWSAFMVVYGLFGISMVDNVIKPLLISRSSRLPFAMTFIGVVGGVLAFGVEGVFIGPVSMAAAVRLAGQYRQAGHADDPPRRQVAGP
ncbi:AI-2E family transporter [Rhodanobacter aciditrophus]|uniref:AI-2E family transporter n=1 Tax=Rhodanobacter aciditrophus TaxID=1623218 RepID=UPI003CF809AD